MPKMYESFSWLRDDLSYAGPIGNKAQFKGVALYPTISGNHREYIAKELEASARTLVNKPVTLNHDSDVKLGNVRWAEHEDGRIEYVIELKDREYIQKLRDKANLTTEQYFTKWGKQPVYGVSVEANYRFHDEECSADGICKITPYGIIFNALSLVEDPEVPGVSGTTIELMEILHEQSYPEARIVGLLLNDYSQWHNMPKVLAESYNRNVVNKLEEKTVKKQTKETKAKKHKDIVAAASVSSDPRAKFLMEQEETPADTGQGECPEGEHKDPETGKCVPDATVTEQEEEPCPEGEVRDPETGECVPKATEQESGCPEGMHKDENDVCVPDEPPKATTPEFPETTPTVPVSPIPAVAESHRFGEPFADYTSHADCVSKNPDKDDPDAYCADLERQVEGETKMKNLETRMATLEKLITQNKRTAQIEEVKRKQRTEDLAVTIKSLQEQAKKLGFKVESINQATSITRTAINNSLNVIEKNFKGIDNWRRGKDALDKRQCNSIGKTQKTLENLITNTTQLSEIVTTQNGKLQGVGVLAKNLVGVVSGLNETQQAFDGDIHGLKASIVTDQTALHNLLGIVTKLQEKVDIGEKAWVNLQKLNKAYEASNATKLQENQKTTDRVKKLEEDNKRLTGELATVKRHVKPNFKATEKSLDAEPQQDVVTKAYA